MTYFPAMMDPAIRLETLDKAVKGFLREYVTTALLRNGCHMQRAAAELGIHRNTLTRICAQAGVTVGTKLGATKARRAA